MLTALGLAAQMYIGIIWILAGSGKLAAGHDAVVISAWLPKRITPPSLVVRLFSVGEVSLGLSIITGILFPITPGISAAFFAFFAVLHLSGRFRGDCGCFGVLNRASAVRPHQLLLWASLSVWLVLTTPHIPAQVATSALATLGGTILAGGAALVAKRRHLAQTAAHGCLGCTEMRSLPRR
jgi:uncharacterized membrane protein YphA (DoxX/SURF4 family)